MKLNSASTFLFKVTQVSNPFAPYQLSYSHSPSYRKRTAKMTLVDDRDRKSSFGFGGRRSMKRYERGNHLCKIEKRKKHFSSSENSVQQFFHSQQRSDRLTNDQSVRTSILEGAGVQSVSLQVVDRWRLRSEVMSRDYKMGLYGQ